ncbi:MAG: ATP-binding protein [Leptospiraceae bacterium]|nr:ATP-binding protein [Leptospiraceae bacterium]
MLDMSLWRRLITRGTNRFNSAPQRKIQKTINQLLLICQIGNLWLALIELACFPFLLYIDAEKYFHYLIWYTLPAVAFALATGLVYFLQFKVKGGWIYLISSGVVSAYLFLLSIYLGPKVQIHLLFFAIMPISYLIYSPEKKSYIYSQISIFCLGILATFYWYAYHSPLFPLPPQVEPFVTLITILTVIAIMISYTYFQWKQNHETEALLVQERDSLHDLLENVIPRLEQAEKKYRHIVEDSDEMIFTLDKAGVFISMNGAVKNLMGFSPSEILGRHFSDFIFYSNDPAQGIDRQLALDRFRRLFEEEHKTSFRVAMRRKYNVEPVELQIHLSLSLSQDRAEIIGKASNIDEDILLTLLKRESGTYAIQNSVDQADILANRLTDILLKKINTVELKLIRGAIREILINAIEHGNLEISFEEKTNAQAKSDYLNFFKQRQQLPKYRNRRVRADFIFDGNRVLYRITDDGKGFDHEKALKDCLDNANENYLEHGRGLAMAVSVFDRVKFNETGNRITLIKNLNTD